MNKYIVVQVWKGKEYPSYNHPIFTDREDAERQARSMTSADESVGEYSTTYRVKELKIAQIDPVRVLKVYIGKDEACRCGCKGKYWYSPAYLEMAETRRGYPIKDDEIDRNGMITKAVNFMNAHLDQIELYSDECAEIKTGRDRVYTIYLTSPDGIEFQIS